MDRYTIVRESKHAITKTKKKSEQLIHNINNNQQ